eukprot:CAMPEP_0170602738 /NCGR_PEP_ID=MMETSP0224-20130122/18549_1 /TAXON_ID=285029 /ORGANISM="Togula jolla, Strain CCCM 725" /LENGTH=64 /DNA_ID=CAMNT_0010927593 /DNA_START=1108 /DNA_END=1299 /DNA_ORIENTATION=-
MSLRMVSESPPTSIILITASSLPDFTNDVAPKRPVPMCLTRAYRCTMMELQRQRWQEYLDRTLE